MDLTALASRLRRVAVRRLIQARKGRKSRKSHMKISQFVAGAVGLALVSGSAWATTLKEIGVINARTVTIGGTGNGYHGSVYAGLYEIAINNDANKFKTFCIDVYDFSPSTYQTYGTDLLRNAPQSVGDTGIEMGLAGETAVRTLWAIGYQAALTDADKAAGLQVAIWEAVNDTATGYNLSSGKFTATGSTAVINYATSFLNQIATYSGPLPSLFAWVNKTDTTHYQDYIGVPDGGATVALLGLAMGTMAIVRRKH